MQKEDSLLDEPQKNKHFVRQGQGTDGSFSNLSPCVHAPRMHGERARARARERGSEKVKEDRHGCMHDVEQV